MYSPKRWICSRCGAQRDAFPLSGTHHGNCLGEVVENLEFRHWSVVRNGPHVIRKLRINLAPLIVDEEAAFVELKRVNENLAHAEWGRRVDRARTRIAGAQVAALEANRRAQVAKTQLAGLEEAFVVAHRELQEQFGYITRQSRQGQNYQGTSRVDVSNPLFEDAFFSELERLPDSGGTSSRRHVFVELRVPIGLTVHKDINLKAYSEALVSLPMTSEELEVKVRCSKCKQEGLSVLNGAVPVLAEHELPSLGIPCRNAGQPLWPEDVACIRHRFWGVDRDDETGDSESSRAGLPQPDIRSVIDAASGQVLAMSEVESRLTEGPSWRF
jgi:hypothetical protein